MDMAEGQAHGAVTDSVSAGPLVHHDTESGRPAGSAPARRRKPGRRQSLAGGRRRGFRGEAESSAERGDGPAQPPQDRTPPTPAVPVAAAGGGFDAIGAAALLPVSAMALHMLTTLSQQYGHGEPTLPAMPVMPPTPKTTASTSAAVAVATHGGGQSQRAEALQELNAELERVLTGSAGTTTEGRSAMAELLAEVDSALTALGPVADTPTGRGLVADTLTDALRRAGVVAGQSRTATAGAAARVDELARRYLQQESATEAPSWSSTRPPLGSPTGTTAEWINRALGVLAGEGIDTSRVDPADIAAVIAHESAGNPDAINLWDSNAAAGHPSKGLMQMIDSTFYAHCAPGHTDIWNPVDNIVAGVRYAVARYGCVAAIPGVIRLHEGLSYVGY